MDDVYCNAPHHAMVGMRTFAGEQYAHYHFGVWYGQDVRNPHLVLTTAKRFYRQHEEKCFASCFGSTRKHASTSFLSHHKRSML